MNNNPTGKNQYTGSLRLKTGKFYHGTSRVFGDRVKPFDKGDKTWATANLNVALRYAASRGPLNPRPRVLQVALPSNARVRPLASHRGVTVASSLGSMRVVRTLPTLHKPSRRKA